MFLSLRTISRTPGFKLTQTAYLSNGDSKISKICAQFQRKHVAHSRCVCSAFSQQRSLLPSTQRHPFSVPQCTISTTASCYGLKDSLETLKSSLGLRMQKHKFFLSGKRLHLCCVELIDYDEYFKEFDLPDTFNSWFKITGLHIWMTLVRLSREGEKGIFVRNSLMKHLWEDSTKRAKKVAKGLSVKSEIALLGEQFLYTAYVYDDGFMGDDKDLASALWNAFFEQEEENPEKVEKLVHFVRKQIKYFDTQDSEELLESGLMFYLPLNGDPDVSKMKKKMGEIYMMVPK
ncbi:hypothetical protein CAPTEDRAFT_161929 [Capitella teleta]|uniref:Ubiquinol-cytochrome c chaperone domain-containing protein n=1 Tax=Capitella teleta TaxID=283909 RepID=R7TZ04_CAPTE|nr:hypothetical protein CAPTEDRAFT_161929 [Capitella teleta]|eukprot:ELT98832.1 hypothetical protein CAPTEDRAFT_161929 [Capitella teleta]